MTDNSKVTRLYEELSRQVSEMPPGQRLTSIRQIMREYSVS
jgi:DNA-binding GntR family transcriptional regulator